MKNIHPLAAFIITVAAALAPAVFPDPVTVLTALLTGAAFAALTGTKGLWRFAVVIFGASLINPLFVHRGATVLFFLNDSPVTAEAFFYGVNIGCLIAAVMLWFSAYNNIMDVEKHLYLFGRFTPRLGVMISMAVRFVPLFEKTFLRVSSAQRAMGMYSSHALYDRIAGRLFAFGAASSMIFETGVTAAASMEARGYGRRRRTSYSLFRPRFVDAALASAGVLLFFVLCVFSEKLHFNFYPQLSRINLALLPRTAYFMLCLLPITVEIMEKIRWKYSGSKISALRTAEPVLRP